MSIGRLTLLTLSVSLVSVLFLGCGGGSGDDSSSSVSDVSLTSDSAENLARSAASALPGCVYESDSVLRATEFRSVDELYINLVKEIVESEKTFSSRSTVINESYDGTCETNPGTYTKIGTHNDGTDDVTYTYNAYCTGDSQGTTTVTGSSHVVIVGTPSDTGPITQYTTIDKGDMTIVEKSDEGTFTHTVMGRDVKYIYGNPGGDPTSSNPDIFELDSWSIVDGRTGGKYRAEDSKITSYGSGDNEVIVIESLTYTDPENGTVHITSTPLISEDDSITQGTITITGSDGTSMTMVPDASVENGFSVVIDEEVIGVMDCSGA